MTIKNLFVIDRVIVRNAQWLIHWKHRDESVLITNEELRWVNPRDLYLVDHYLQKKNFDFFFPKENIPPDSLII
jgi:hypothetical protein